ncbi:hypothetical protein E2L06_03565 [Haloterrigena sp. H1]|uniref:hypothetical protein n=1 Tax=Haloterrigena sp. H1 TaxID=2552943 RepID=UPI00110E4A2A|nr:hypothetical protein [Haloterrigena sp. H1]TMT85719.1 hypothetical protein E2L06_03565 [Haloterrigena sp. H1]
MGLFAGLLNVLSASIVVVFVGRAVLKLLENPDQPHHELVSARERHATTIIGIPLTLVGLSTMVDGPLAVPYNALLILLPGIVLLVYPDFSPSGV